MVRAFDSFKDLGDGERGERKRLAICGILWCEKVIMKRIGVLSDTHLSVPDKRLDRIVERYFSGVDMFVHAGDVVSLPILDCLYATGKEVIAVSGNMDLREIEHAFPTKRILEIEDVRIGIIHGWGSPHGIRAWIKESFEHVDAIIYGHTHQGFSGFEDGILFFNPGAPLDSRFTTVNSIGIMEIDGKNMRGELILL